MILNLLLPALGLMVLSLAVTRGVEAVMPESLRGLAAIALVSALLVWVLTAAGFALLYLMEDSRVLALMSEAPSASVGHFLGLAARAALIWAPVLLLTVSTAPRRWKTAVW